jgi:curved DNA-binding protein CbpA
MKDYYYILGVPPNATEQQIRTAYKKLSILFHPDKNGGDKFFEDRFKEIQEAYQALAENQRRDDYNQQLNNFHQPDSQSHYNTAAPVIRTFDVSKKLVNEGELITITWSVQNADSLHISPIGLLPVSGTKTIRLPNLVGKPLVTLILTATNTFVQQSVEKQIVIENKNFKNKPIQYLQEKNPVQEKRPTPTIKNKETTNPPQALVTIPKKENGAKTATIASEGSPQTAIYAYVTMAIMIFLAVVMAFYVYQLNSFKP